MSCRYQPLMIIKTDRWRCISAEKVISTWPVKILRGNSTKLQQLPHELSALQGLDLIHTNISHMRIKFIKAMITCVHIGWKQSRCPGTACHPAHTNNQKYIRNPHCVPKHTNEYKSNYYVRKRSNYLIQKLLQYVLVMV